MSELKQLVQEHSIKTSELVMIKTLLEIHETYIMKTQSPHY